MSGNSRYTCAICGKSFASSGNLYTHKSVHSNIRKYMCHVCDRTYKTKGDLSQHLQRVHLRKKKYSCVFCKKHFFAKGELDSHIIAHIKETAWICKFCKREFKSKNNLHFHIAKCHSKSAKSFHCQKCDLSFETNPELAKHIKRVHENCLNARCKICFKNFSNRDSLNRHNKTVHFDNRIFKCKTCTSAFKSAWYLRIHELSHSKQNRVQCKFCGKHVKSKTLKNHYQYHRKRPYYKCKLCERRFVRLLDLKQHILNKHGKQFPLCSEASKFRFPKAQPVPVPKLKDQSAVTPMSSVTSSSSPQQNIQNSKSNLINDGSYALSGSNHFED